MKILITNHHLRNRAGSELFTFELAKHLKERGHNVFVFSFDLGGIAEKIKELNISVTDNLSDFRNIRFDIIHAQHNIAAIIARSVFQKVPMVFMSHGFLPELEQSPSIDLGISKFIAVSEEVAENLKKNNRIPDEKIEIIRNFVDTQKFISKKNVNRVPKKLLVISNHYIDQVKNIVERSCIDLDIEVRHIGLPENSVENVVDYINESDIIVTLGRGCLEAMACERNVIVYDIHGGDGFLDEKNFYDIRKNNFSGRRNGFIYSVEEFKNEISKYNPDQGKKLRKIIENENSINTIISSIEKIYFSVLKSNTDVISQIKNNQLYNEIIFLENDIKRANHLLNTLAPKEQELQQKNQELQQKEQELQQKNQELQQKEQEIQFIKSSKFWKLRQWDEKIKFALFSPIKFVKKYISEL